MRANRRTDREACVASPEGLVMEQWGSCEEITAFARTAPATPLLQQRHYSRGVSCKHSARHLRAEECRRAASRRNGFTALVVRAEPPEDRWERRLANELRIPLAAAPTGVAAPR